MIHQLQTDDWVANGAETVICRLPFTVAQAEKQFGLAFAQGEPGTTGQAGRSHAVIEHEGQAYLLHAARQAASPDHLLEVVARGDVRYPEPLVAKICAAFKLAAQDLPWVSPDLGERPWALWRLDDNNNRTVMAYFKDRRLAERAAQMYTQRGHRQLYYVDDSPAPAGCFVRAIGPRGPCGGVHPRFSLNAQLWRRPACAAPGAHARSPACATHALRPAPVPLRRGCSSGGRSRPCSPAR